MSSDSAHSPKRSIKGPRRLSTPDEGRTSAVRSAEKASAVSKRVIVVRARSMLGGSHHEYRLVPALVQWSNCEAQADREWVNTPPS